MALNYIEINNRALNLLLSVKKHVHSIDGRLKALVELRVSQIVKIGVRVEIISKAKNLG